MPRREDDFDKALSEFAPEQEAGVGNVVIFFLVSVFCAVLPGYLFTTPMIGMDLMENMPVYAGVTAISGLLLTFASTRVADGLFRAAKQKAKGGKGSEQLEELQKQEAIGFSMFKNNVMYLFLTLFLAFWLIPTFTEEQKVRYALSVASPACIMAYLASYY